MRKSLYALTVVLVMALLSGCMMTFTASDGRLGYGKLPARISRTVPIKASESFFYFLSPAILPFGKPHENLDKLLLPEMQKTNVDYVTNLKINYGFTVTDFIITMFTSYFGIGRATVEVEGNGVSF